MKVYLIGIAAAFCASLILLMIILPLLKRLKAGQYILGYVKEHKDKGGTPTMGGLAFITAIIAVGLIISGVRDGRVRKTRDLNLTRKLYFSLQSQLSPPYIVISTKLPISVFRSAEG